MKKLFITPLLFLLCFTAFSQKWDFEVRAKHTNSIKKEKLFDVTTMSDIIPSYPAKWISGYVSTEILATCNGKSMKAWSSNDVLSPEQKNLLSNADLSTDLVINIIYTCKNAVTEMNETCTMHHVTTLVPDAEAEYTGGKEELTKYLKENAINKIQEENSNRTVQALVKFIVNEQGEITEVTISRASGDENIDKLLLETITKMPTWKPAQNAKGEKVKQVFEFSLNSPNMGGC